MTEPLKTEYHYFRNDHGLPLVTVCYLRMPPNMPGETEPWTAIGIAICSDTDMPCKKTGRAIARQRAIHAVNSNSGDLHVSRIEARTILESVQFPCAIPYKATMEDDPAFRYRHQQRSETQQGSTHE